MSCGIVSHAWLSWMEKVASPQLVVTKEMLWVVGPAMTCAVRAGTDAGVMRLPSTQPDGLMVTLKVDVYTGAVGWSFKTMSRFNVYVPSSRYEAVSIVTVAV